MKIRIITKIAECGNAWYFPQYYTKKYFFGFFGGWKDFIEDKGVDPLGFAYSDGSVQFYKKKDCINFLNRLNYKNKIVYENSK